MPLKAVLFDFDGVIADTENVHVAAWQRALARMGLELDDATAARAGEVDDRTFVADLFASRGLLDADLDGWVARKQGIAEALLADAPRIYPGVPALVGLLRETTRLAVVTTTWRRNVEVVLESSGLRDAFELIVAKEDVASPKPTPEGYSLALTRLRIGPEEAVAIEDSPGGVASARGAGLRVVAVGHRRAEGDWSAGARFLTDLADRDRARAVILGA